LSIHVRFVFFGPEPAPAPGSSVSLQPTPPTPPDIGGVGGCSKRITYKDIKGYNKDMPGYIKVMLFGYQYGLGYYRIALKDTLFGYHIWIHMDNNIG
jgi:hypothetical protein